MSWTNFRRFRRAAAGLTVLALAGLLAFSSCGRPPDGGVEGNEPKHCDELLDSALTMMQPEQIGFSASIPTIRTRLNNWLNECGNSPTEENSASETKPAPDVARLVEGLLNKNEIERLAAGGFDDRDIRHVRNCLLFKRINGSVLVSGSTMLERAVELFYYTVKNIEIVSPDDPRGELPLPPFRILLYGQGTAADRAWIFADLLRQMRVDTVILRPRTPRAGEAAQTSQNGHAERHWLVGVLLDEQVYLFDPQMGLPVPAADDEPSADTDESSRHAPRAVSDDAPPNEPAARAVQSDRSATDGTRSVPATFDGPKVLVRRPATLKQFVTDPAVANALNAGGRKYPLTPADLKDPEVLVIGHRSLWSQRMQTLQESLSGERAVLVCDPLILESRLGEGLVSRVAGYSAAGWKKEAIGVWDWPEQRWQSFENPTEQVRTAVAERDRVFGAPYEITADKQTGAAVSAGPSRELLSARLAHLAGRYHDALRGYLYVRFHADLPAEVDRLLSPEIQQQNEQAVHDASFWTALCQYEQGDYETAAKETLEDPRFLRPSGKWHGQSRYLLGLCYARQNKFRAALYQLTELERNRPDHPQNGGNALLVERWRKLAETTD